MNLNIKGFLAPIVAIIVMAVVACSCTPPPDGDGSTTTTTTTTVVEPTTWEFSLRVGMPADLVAKYGGEVAVRVKVEQQLTSVNARFTGFDKPIVWRMNEFFVFTGGALDQLAVPHPNSDYQLLYSENTALDDGGWKPQSRTIVVRWTPASGGVFGPYGADSLIHELGHARGAIDMYGLNVNGANNSVNGQGYTPAGGFMTYPYGATAWDDYSTRVINASADMVYNDDRIVRQSIPVVQVHATKNGAPVNGATVELFGSSWYSGSVNSFASQAGTTTNGAWTIPANPFEVNPVAFWKLSFPLLLVRVTSGASVGYGWLALPDTGSWFFTHPSEAYQLNVNLA